MKAFKSSKRKMAQIFTFLKRKKKLNWNEEAPKNKRNVIIRNACSVTFFFFFEENSYKTLMLRAQAFNQKGALSCKSNLDKGDEEVRVGVPCVHKKELACKHKDNKQDC